ncbi:MAG: hypothetical protein ACJ75B_19605 [Flavisolibacter sp.]
MKYSKPCLQALTFLIFFQLVSSAQNNLATKEKNPFAIEHSLSLISKAPSFLYQGDHLELSIELQNHSDSELTGQVQLELFDALSHQSVDGWFINSFPNQYFTVGPGQKESLNFPMQVPFNFDEVVLYRFTAVCNQRTQIKQDLIPVLGYSQHRSERVNITKSGNGNYRLEKLLQSGADESIRSSSLIVEGGSNPTQPVLQALPYLLATSFEDAVDTWNKLYALQLSTRPEENLSNPDSQSKDSMNLLVQNPELLGMIMQDLPWTLEERSQENLVAYLHSAKNLEEENLLKKLKRMQKPDGSFSWMEDGNSDAFTTEYILAGLGRLKKLRLKDDRMNFILKAVDYLDSKFVQEFQINKLLAAGQISYLYARSFFSEIPLKENAVKVFLSALKQIKQSWTNQATGLQAMMALILYRSGDSATAKTIVQALKKSIVSTNKKKTDSGSSWWQQQTSSDALVLEALTEISGDKKSMFPVIKDLVERKGLRSWFSPVQTADASYALLLASEQFEEEETIPMITIGNLQLANDHSEYLEHIVEGREVKPEMGRISVHNQNAGRSDEALPFLGAVYWNYIQDSATLSSSSAFYLKRTLSRENKLSTAAGDRSLQEGAVIRTGDTVEVTIIVQALRNLDYVVVKDMRPAGAVLLDFTITTHHADPYINQKRGFADMFFYIDHLKKGIYYFKYRLLTTEQGSFSTGITSVECMYAPQYRAEIKGKKMVIENNGN